jgi:hypothetical protein
MLLLVDEKTVLDDEISGDIINLNCIMCDVSYDYNKSD